MTVTDAKDRVAFWAAAYGVPANIALAVAQRESGFQDWVVGKKGELGVMQLMPATAIGLKVNAADPEQNIEGGVRLLHDNYARFGDWSYALAAYNCGPTCASKGPDAWPKATYNYVAAVVGTPPSYPPSDGATGDWEQEPPPAEEASVLEADPLVLAVAAVGAFLLLYYFTD
jgi:soluble lytic murein transglycosylase-like protein